MPTSLGEASLEVAPPPPRPSTGKPVASLWGEDGFTFGDLLDIVNPLQHIPGISQLYRELTGDEIAYGPRVMGGALFGGVIGLIASLVNVIVDDETGKDIGEHAVAMLFGGDDDEPGSPQGDPMVAVASAETTPMSDAADYAADYTAEPPAPRPAANRPPVEYAGIDVTTPMNDSIELALAPAPAPALATAGKPPMELAEADTMTPMNDSIFLVSPPLAAAPARPARVVTQVTQARAEPAIPAAPVVPVAPILSAAMLSTRAPVPGVPGTPGGAPGATAPASTEDDTGRPLASLFDERFAGTAVPGPWVAKAMMSGLDKYRAMALERVRVNLKINDEF